MVDQIETNLHEATIKTMIEDWQVVQYVSDELAKGSWRRHEQHCGDG